MPPARPLKWRAPTYAPLALVAGVHVCRVTSESATSSTAVNPPRPFPVNIDTNEARGCIKDRPETAGLKPEATALRSRQDPLHEPANASA